MGRRLPDLRPFGPSPGSARDATTVGSGNADKGGREGEPGHVAQPGSVHRIPNPGVVGSNPTVPAHPPEGSGRTGPLLRPSRVRRPGKIRPERRGHLPTGRPGTTTPPPERLRRSDRDGTEDDPRTTTTRTRGTIHPKRVRRSHERGGRVGHVPDLGTRAEDRASGGGDRRAPLGGDLGVRRGGRGRRRGVGDYRRDGILPSGNGSAGIPVRSGWGSSTASGPTGTSRCISEGRPPSVPSGTGATARVGSRTVGRGRVPSVVFVFSGMVSSKFLNTSGSSGFGMGPRGGSRDRSRLRTRGSASSRYEPNSSSFPDEK